MPKYQTTREAYQLLHEGQLALAEMEHQGVRVDKGYLDEALKKTRGQIRDLEHRLREDPVYRREWKRRYGDKAKLGSRDQIAAVVFGDLGYPVREMTAGGEEGEGRKRAKADESAFDHVDLPFVKDWVKCEKLKKARSTYLVGIRRELAYHDGAWFVHPSYNLNTVTTFRSSCNDPNWQNIPSRVPEFAKMIRRCYIPLHGHQLVEIDYGQMEFRIPHCYNFDPVLLDYISDTSKDIHRDTAQQLFFLGKDDAKEKTFRHVAKNGAVFPLIYGSYYVDCARNVWAETVSRGAKVKSTGTGIGDHLAKNGIRELGACDPAQRPRPGTFEAHVKSIEDWFWKKFSVFAQWKRDWHAAYLRDGGLMMLSGFAVNGHHKRNDVTNYPIQGSAFHCLLWSLVRAVREIRRLRFRSRLVGQIHDCAVGNVHPAERDDYIDLLSSIMTDEIKRAWKWITVPLVVEAEVCPIDGPWNLKTVWEDSGSGYVPKDLGKWEEAHGPFSKQLAN